MPNENTDNQSFKNDKQKIAILISIIVFVVILIALFSFLVFLDINSKSEANKLSTTTRRTVKIEYSGENIDGDKVNQNNESSSTTTTSTTVKSTSKNNSSKKTTKIVTSTKIITSVSTKVVEVLPPSISHEVVNDRSTYPNALDAWEWEIVNSINKERRKRGLNELAVARDLRQLAEEAADLWVGSGSEVVKNYLTGHANYRKQTNYDDVTASSLYNDTVEKTQVTTNDSLKYLGVGVLYKNDTYYYVIVYE